MKIIKQRRFESVVETTIHKIQKKLHILPSPALSFQIDSLDSDGNVTERIISKSNSFTRNAAVCMIMMSGAAQGGGGSVLYQDGCVAVKTASSGSVILMDTYGLNSNTSLGGFDSGTSAQTSLRVGTSSQAETKDDFKLISEILQGTTAAGSLNHSTTMATGPIYDAGAGVIYTLYSRTLSNITSSPITIREIGMYRYVFKAGTFLLWCRDVLATPITINQGETKSVAYTIKCPV